MNVCIEKASSRPLGVAQRLIHEPINESVVYSKTVVLTGEREILATPNGRWCFIDALALLTRVVGNLNVVIPPGLDEFADEVEDICSRAWCRGTLTVMRGDSEESLLTSHAILNVGTRIKPSMPCTVINSNGWVARVSSRGQPLPSDVGQSNPLGAMMAASLGVTEVFKRIYGVPKEVAPLPEKTEFSLFEQTISPTGSGPELPEDIRMPDTLLTGGGAIGNGIVMLLSQLPVSGRVHIVDKQDYAEENLGTCMLVERTGWLGEPKAIQLATWLKINRRLDVTGEKALIESVVSKPMPNGLSINLVINGLDDIGARRASQKLWPEVIIDGGINEIGAAVTQYRLYQPGKACLQCWFEEQLVDNSNDLGRLTGLNADLLADAGRLLTEEEIAQAPEDKQPWLRKLTNEGKAVCSIISEAVLASKLGLNVEEGFRPSAPFVATAAAAMVMAEAVKALAFPSAPVASMFQIASLFFGPAASQSLTRPPTAACSCVAHRSQIVRLWQKRKPAI